MEKFAASLGKLVSSFGLMFFSGFILWKMWSWFIVPLGAAAITYWHALGLYTIVILVTSRLILKTATETTDVFKMQFLRLFVLSVLLGVSYLISTQM